MGSYHINEIASVLEGELIKESGGKISYLLIDSRKVLFPRESLFFALRGKRNDGHLFLTELYRIGVRNFVVEEIPTDKENYNRANFIKVADSLIALQRLVAWHRSGISVPVVGITGSNGKTIVKEWIFQCLSRDKYIIRNPKSFNSQVGVPLSVWLLDPDADVGVFEAGISKPGEMQILENIIKPTIGIFTNIGDAHQEYFESMEQKTAEKLQLFRHCKTIIYSKDSELVHRQVLKFADEHKTLFTWSTLQDADLFIGQIDFFSDHTRMKGVYNGEISWIKIPFVDKASVENAISVWCLMLVLGYTSVQITERLEKLESVGMRLELKEGINNCTIINDSYNSDLESLHIALDFLSYQNQQPQKVLILSDIAQSGYQKRELYERVASMVKQKNIDRLIGIGPDIHQFESLFELRKDFFDTTQEFLSTFSFSRFIDMAILLKGARSFEFEQISKVLQRQSHRTVLEIDLDAISYNLNYFKGLIKPTTGIIAMVKAFSYGSGTHEIANLCQYQKVAALAVAFPDEGIDLRKNGIRVPIIVMNPEEDNFSSIVENNLEPVLYNLKSLREFNQVAITSDIHPYPVHIKLDTGMHRSGFLKKNLPDLLEQIHSFENIRIKTIFSHLAAADEPEQDAFTIQQIELFDEMSITIMNHLDYKVKRHILNSAGIERFPTHQYDFVRLGIGLYGVSVKNANLAQVGSLYSSIVQIKKVPAGETVGYNRKGKIVRDSDIATVPIGYADGLRRSLGNGVGKFWINGNQVPIVGNICMDMCMIDVSGLDVNEGDRVEFFGKNQTLEEVALWMQTIPYEVLTSISRRVKRTYHVE